MALEPHERVPLDVGVDHGPPRLRRVDQHQRLGQGVERAPEAVHAVALRSLPGLGRLLRLVLGQVVALDLPDDDFREVGQDLQRHDAGEIDTMA